MGNRVERVRTTVSEPQIAQAIVEGWQQLFGNIPTKQQVGLVVAQNSLETGHRKSMWNNNVGNITTDGKGVYDFYDDLSTDEQLQPGVWKKMNLKYRSYPSLIEGVKDYLRLLSSNHYSKAWENILHPDPVAFSKALKQSGYYTANEAPYTKTMTQLYSQFNNSDSYEKARSGQVGLPSVTPQKEDIFQKYLARFKGKDMNIYDQLARNKPSVQNSDNKLDTVLDNYLQMIAASEKVNKKLYKKYLPTNHVLIQVASLNYTNSIEFAHILCCALDEELVSTSFTHTNGKMVEVECAIPGPANECFEAVKQLTNAIADTFKHATLKIGGLQIKTKLVMDQKSFHPQITLTAAETQHRKFLLKFI